jgi:hypothetical protein
MDFFQAQHSLWAVNSANSSGKIICSSSSFEGTDPLPEKAKQCFCDDSSQHVTSEAILWVKDYWRNKALEEKARLAKIKIEAEAIANVALAQED